MIIKRLFRAICFFLTSLCASTLTIGLGLYLGFETQFVQCLAQRTSSFFFPQFTWESIQWNLPLKITLNRIHLKENKDQYTEKVIFEGGISPGLSGIYLHSVILEKPTWIFSDFEKYAHSLQKKSQKSYASFPLHVKKIYLKEGNIQIKQERGGKQLLSFEAIEGMVDFSSLYPLLDLQAKCTYTSSQLPGSIKAQLSCTSSVDHLLCSYFGKIENLELDQLHTEQLPPIYWTYHIQKNEKPSHVLQVTSLEKDLMTCSWNHFQDQEGTHIAPVSFMIKEADLQFEGVFHIKNSQWKRNSFLKIKIGKTSPLYNLIGESGGKIFFLGSLLKPQIVFSEENLKENYKKNEYFPSKHSNTSHWSYIHQFNSSGIHHDFCIEVDYSFYKENYAYALTLRLSGEIPFPGERHLFFWIDSQTDLNGFFKKTVDWREIRSLTRLKPNLQSLPQIEFSFIGENSFLEPSQQRRALSFDSILSCKNIFTPHYVIEDFTLDLSNRTGEIVSHILFSGRVNCLPFHLHGTCHLSSFDRNFLQGSLFDLEGQLDDLIFYLDHPFRFFLSSEHIQIEQATLWINQGKILFELDQGIEEFAAQLTLKRCPSRLLTLLTNISIEGFLDGKGSLIINLHRQELHVHLKEESQKINLTVSLLENQIDALIRLHENWNQPFFIRGQLPIRLEPFFPYFFFEETLPFSCKASLNLPLDLIKRLFWENEPWEIQGTCSLICEAHGPLNNTRIMGKIGLTKGSFLYPEKGLYLNKIAGTLYCEGKQISWNLIEGHSLSKGKVFSKGIISWAKEELYLKMKMDLEDACLFDTDFLTIQGTGSLVLSLSQNEKTLTGELDIKKAVCRLPEHSTKLIPLIYPTEEHVLSASGNAFDIDLNVTLKSNGTLSVEEDGVLSIWKGTLQALGSIRSPQLQGTCQSTYGTIRVGEHYFDLKQGNLTFQGDFDSTYIRLLAELPLQRYLIVATYQGTFLNPKLLLSSRPANLSTRKIVSLILFGKTETGSIDLLEAFGKTSSSNYSGRDLIRKIKKSLQIDHIGLTTTPNERESQYSLQIGKHLTKNILFILQKKLNRSGAMAGIYTQISQNFSIRAEAGVPREACLHFLLRFNY